jgi:hypothetical protein
MLSYFFRRSLISLNQRKLWFLLPLLLSGIFASWLYFSSPCVFSISQTYQPPKTIPIAVEGTDLMTLWNETIDVMPTGTQFINSKVRQISKNRKIVQAWTSDPQNREKEIAARKGGGIGRYIVNDIKDHFLIQEVPAEGDNAPSQIRFAYEGTNQNLGDQLIAFYSQTLIEHWQGELKSKLKRENLILSRLAALTDEDEDEDEDEREEISPEVLEKIQTRQSNIDHLGAQIALLGGRFSTIEKVELERKVSDGIVIRSLIFLLLAGLALTGILVGAEFFSKSFTTELQVSQYLGIRLIGTIKKLDAIQS